MPKVWPMQNDRAAMAKVFGEPDVNRDGAADPSWAAKWLTVIVPPYRMVLAWDTKQVVKKITVNVGCAKELHSALSDIKALYGTQAEIEAHGLHLFGGVYNFRPKRGGKTLSTHAYGAGIDLDPAANAQHNSHGTMPKEVVAIFAKYGAEWGGSWSKASVDPMHFQFARTK